MSELMAAAAQIVPYVTAAAATMGMHVLASTQDRIADSAVDRGRAFLGRLLPGRDGAPDGAAPAHTEPATRVIAGLPASDRAALELAIGNWLDACDLSAPALTRCIERAAHTIVGPSGGAHAYGPGGTAIGQVVGDVHIGDRPGPAQGP